MEAPCDEDVQLIPQAAIDSIKNLSNTVKDMKAHIKKLEAELAFLRQEVTRAEQGERYRALLTSAMWGREKLASLVSLPEDINESRSHSL